LSKDEQSAGARHPAWTAGALRDTTHHPSHHRFAVAMGMAQE